VRVQGSDSEFETTVDRPELLGEFYAAPIASVVAGGARLMLATLERLVTDAGGTWAVCDTDSMAIVASERGGPLLGTDRRVLSWAEVESIRQRFAALNPFDRRLVPGSILKLEEVNLGAGGKLRELWCFAIAAKRYALFTVDDAGEPVLVKWSEHGFGHLLNPTDPDSDDRDWILRVWEAFVREALGLPTRELPWLDRPAVGRVSVSSPVMLRLFDALNAGKPYADQVKPFNFLLTAFVAPFGQPSGADAARFQLVAPYTRDPRQWTKRRWIDRYSGGSFAVTTTGDAGDRGVARVRTYRDVIAEYRVHPEAKSAGGDGKSCGPETRGLLQRRHVGVHRIRYVGKESNQIEEVDAGIVHDLDEVSLEYRDPRRDPWWTDGLPRLRQMSTAVVARELSVAPSTVKRWKSGRHMPRRAAKRTMALLEVS
jgi:hypothetical protein